jgi:3-hydroxy-9,10-secoandrosta-1,3,5(10)-triene-9,17-dione monooxygenase
MTDHTEMVARARALTALLRERAEATEQLRRMPDDIEQALHDSGLFRVMQPARVGGNELGIGILVDAAAELAKGCASSAWNFANYASHHWMLGMYAKEAQDRVWDDAPDALIASGLSLSGTAEHVAGGYRLSGRWPFSSGVDNSQWNMLGGRVEADGPRLFLLPASDYTIVDTWQAAGLCGTGSKDVTVDDAFVPEALALPMSAFRGGPTPGAAVNAGPLYRLPLMALAPYVLGGVAVGVALGAVESFVQETRQRVGLYFGGNMAERQVIQLKLAEAAAKAEMARLSLRTRCAEAMAEAEAGILPELARKVVYRRDGAFAVRLATEAVTTLFGVTGASGLYHSHPMQRALRDAHAIASHIHLNFDVGGTMYGRVALGLDLDGPPL